LYAISSSYYILYVLYPPHTIYINAMCVIITTSFNFPLLFSE